MLKRILGNGTPCPCGRARGGKRREMARRAARAGGATGAHDHRRLPARGHSNAQSSDAKNKNRRVTRTCPGRGVLSNVANRLPAMRQGTITDAFSCEKQARGIFSATSWPRKVRVAPDTSDRYISMLETRTGRNIDVVSHILPSARRSDSSLAMADWVTSASSPTVAIACVRRGSA